MPSVTCGSCGEPFEAKRSTAKFCSSRCRTRAHRKPKPTAAIAQAELDRKPAAAAETPAVQPETGPLWEGPLSLEAAALAQLRDAGQETSALGTACIVLARRIDSGVVETGAALATMVGQFKAVLAEALDDGSVDGDPVDELQRKRDEKVAQAQAARGRASRRS